ncbi:hypothetical protein C2E23DRAFT_810142 [Lenzites betulinus]|nr:hypothetical protein C2E23DRAFT_810142 [Lenzites betulinus]
MHRLTAANDDQEGYEITRGCVAVWCRMRQLRWNRFSSRELPAVLYGATLGLSGSASRLADIGSST